MVWAFPNSYCFCKLEWFSSVICFNDDDIILQHYLILRYDSLPYPAVCFLSWRERVDLESGPWKLYVIHCICFFCTTAHNKLEITVNGYGTIELFQCFAILQDLGALSKWTLLVNLGKTITITLNQGQQTFSVKVWVVNILGFEGQYSLLATTHLCRCNVKAA